MNNTDNEAVLNSEAVYTLALSGWQIADLLTVLMHGDNEELFQDICDQISDAVDDAEQLDAFLRILEG